MHLKKKWFELNNNRGVILFGVYGFTFRDVLKEAEHRGMSLKTCRLNNIISETAELSYTSTAGAIIRGSDLYRYSRYLYCVSSYRNIEEVCYLHIRNATQIYKE